MHAIRLKGAASNINVSNAIEVLQNPACDEFTIFASSTDESKANYASDGPSTNFPLVVALARLKLTKDENLFIVFDGVFLTAQRSQRAQEVGWLLDACVQTRKAFYVKEVAPFTAILPPELASAKLAATGPKMPLNLASRPSYFALLQAGLEQA